MALAMLVWIAGSKVAMSGKVAVTPPLVIVDHSVAAGGVAKVSTVPRGMAASAMRTVRQAAQAAKKMERRLMISNRRVNAAGREAGRSGSSNELVTEFVVARICMFQVYHQPAKQHLATHPRRKGRPADDLFPESGTR